MVGDLVGWVKPTALLTHLGLGGFHPPDINAGTIPPGCTNRSSDLPTHPPATASSHRIAPLLTRLPGRDTGPPQFSPSRNPSKSAPSKDATPLAHFLGFLILSISPVL